jgi:AcrR family transcriptional regulator
MIEAAMCEHAVSLSRQRILNAAMQVAVRDGVLAITLDAVAREAGISKGGLIHHFRTKDDLISAMLEHFRVQTLQTMEERIAIDENPRGRSFRAMVGMVLQPALTDQGEGAVPSGMCRFFTALLAASANNPGLLDSFRRSMGCMREKLLAEGPNGLRQVALWPAIHGLLLWQHLGVICAEDPIFQSLIDELLGLAGGPDPTVPGVRAAAVRRRQRTGEILLEDSELGPCA